MTEDLPALADDARVPATFAIARRPGVDAQPAPARADTADFEAHGADGSVEIAIAVRA